MERAEQEHPPRTTPTGALAQVAAGWREQPAPAVLKPLVEADDDQPGGWVQAVGRAHLPVTEQDGRTQPLRAVSTAGSGGAEHRQVSPSAGISGVAPLTT